MQNVASLQHYDAISHSLCYDNPFSGAYPPVILMMRIRYEHSKKFRGYTALRNV